MSEEAIQFGRTLRVLRTTAGFSMRAVAAEVGLKPALLGQIERGLAPPPDGKIIKEIAAVIGVPAPLLVSLSHQARASAIEVLQEVADATEFLQAAQRVGLTATDYASLTVLLKKEGVEGLRRRLRTNGDTEAPATGGGDLRLAARLDPALVFARLPTPTAEKLFDEVARKVVKKVTHVDAETIVRVLTRREGQGSTGLGNGVAVPHGVFEELSESLLVVGTVPNGIEFDAPDGLPVRLVFALLGAAEDRADHLELLARIARICTVPGAIKKLIRAKTSAELHKRLRKLDQSVA